MMKKTLFGIISCGLLIGVSTYWIIKYLKKISKNNNEEMLNEKDSMNISPKHVTEDDEVDLDAIKKKSANSMYDRHKEAAQVIKESIEKTNENVELPSEHEEEFDNMFEELDVLSEKR